MKHFRALFIFLLCLCLASPALGETFEGSIVADRTQVLTAETDGSIASVAAVSGLWVAAGQPLLAFAETPVFAQRGGTVSAVWGEPGQQLDGTLISYLPTERYTVYFDSKKAYEDFSHQLIHAGEQVYLRCSNDSSHKAVGTVTHVTAEDWQVEVIGGQLYVGETVYAYRDRAMTPPDRVGMGTVLSAEPVDCDLSGWLRTLNVSEGDRVYRGQLLYTWSPMEHPVINAETDCLVTSVKVAEGDTVKAGQALLEWITADRLRIAFTADEKQVTALNEGDPVRFTCAAEAGAAVRTGIIEEILLNESSGTWTVRVRSEALPLYLGSSVEIRTE